MKSAAHDLPSRARAGMHSGLSRWPRFSRAVSDEMRYDENQDRYRLGADLVVEVVSPDDPDRDLVEKRADYAEGGIPEYWIADPRDETITVFTLKDGAYVEHGVFGRGGSATSPLLEGFAADVSAVFDAPEPGA